MSKSKEVPCTFQVDPCSVRAAVRTATCYIRLGAFTSAEQLLQPFLSLATKRPSTTATYTNGSKVLEVEGLHP